MLKWLLIAGLTGVLIACGAANAVRPITGSASVDAEVLGSSVLDGDVSIDVRFRIENRGQTPLVYFPCSSVLERKEGNTYSVVWSRLCSSTYGLTIPPSEVSEDTLRVRFRREAGGTVWPNGSISGEYRVTVALSTDRAVLVAASDRISNAFLLQEP
jgi:hypothetical protein